MTALQVSYLVLAMLMGLRFLRQHEHRGYVCPQCGTTRQAEHAEGCAWKRHYEDGD